MVKISQDSDQGPPSPIFQDQKWFFKEVMVVVRMTWQWTSRDLVPILDTLASLNDRHIDREYFYNDKVYLFNEIIFF